jgi:hypothetical protein
MHLFKILLGILGYWELLFKTSSRSSRLQRPPWGRPCWTPCSYARRSRCLYASFNQDHALVLLHFLEHQTSHAVCFNARALLYECVFDALWIFFIVISIYRKPACYTSLDLSSIRKTTNRSAAKLICSSFLSWPTCMLLDLSIALWLHHDLPKVVAPIPRSGACETWVPLGPHRPGSWSCPTSGSGLLEDLWICQWAQST